MGSQKIGKINQLLKDWPKGTVATSAQLDRLGISRQLASKYVYYNWIERLGTGAYIRSDDTVEWQGGLHALQAQLGMTVHVGGRTALELQGRSHFVPLGRQAKVTLVSNQPEQLPTWFRNHPWTVRVEHRCLSLFKFKQVPDKTTTRLDCGGFEIVISSPERAIMEQMRLANNNDQIEQAYQLMEGLSTLRPNVVQALLESCQSAKVKRLFLWCAEATGHEWFGRLDSSRFDLGKGKRQIYKGGELNQKYRITIPKSTELPRV
jgi:hypothetical protein